MEGIIFVCNIYLFNNIFKKMKKKGGRGNYYNGKKYVRVIIIILYAFRFSFNVKQYKRDTQGHRIHSIF